MDDYKPLGTLIDSALQSLAESGRQARRSYNSYEVSHMRTAIQDCLAAIQTVALMVPPPCRCAAPSSVKPPTTGATSLASSAHTPGLATKLWPWHGASHPSWQTHDLREIIEDYFKSLGYMPPELRATWIDSSTLQLMLVSRTPSGSNEDGSRGPVDRE